MQTQSFETRAAFDLQPVQMLGVFTPQAAHFRLQFWHWPAVSMNLAPVHEQVLAESEAPDLQVRQLLAAVPVQVAQLEWQAMAAQLPLPSNVNPALQVQVAPVSTALLLQAVQVEADEQVRQEFEQATHVPVLSMKNPSLQAQVPVEVLKAFDLQTRH